MDKYTERYQILQNEVELRIKQEFARLGKEKIFLTDPEELNDEVLYTLPFFVKVSKHGFYSEYGIHTIRMQDGEIFLDALERGENSDDGTIPLSKMQELYSLCDIADRLSSM